MRKKIKKKKPSRSKKPRQINEILVPLDGSKNSFRALEMALFLAKSHKAKITGITIIDLQPVLEYAVLDPISKRLEKQALRFLKKSKAKASKSRVSFSSTIIHGSAGSSLVNFGHKKKFDLIVMGARGLGSFSGIVLGSVSNFVIQKSKLPIVIVK